MRNWSLHFCPLDKECRKVGAPARLNIGTPWWFASIALTPDAKVQKYPHNLEHFGWWSVRPRRGQR